MSLAYSAHTSQMGGLQVFSVLRRLVTSPHEARVDRLHNEACNSEVSILLIHGRVAFPPSCDRRIAGWPVVTRHSEHIGIHLADHFHIRQA